MNLWFRLYTEVLNNPKVQGLRPELFRIWINVLCVAKVTGGTLPPVAELAFRLRISEKAMGRALADLSESRLIDEMESGVYRPHDWDEHQYASDSSTERVRKYRMKQAGNGARNGGGNTKGNVSVTPQSRADTEQSRNRVETDPERETPCAEVRSIRPQEHSTTPSGISPATWDDFQNRYAESGKPLNEADWVKASMEALTLDLSDSDMTERVIPSLAAELPGWADRDLSMIPYPASWLRSQPWTRKGKARPAVLTREEQRAARIDAEWGGARATQ